MSLAAPGFLLVLFVLPLAAAAQTAARHRRRRFAVRLPTAGVLAIVAADQPPWRRRISPILMTAAVIALVIALARPHTTVAVPVEKASVMLVTDASRSMEATDVEPNRLAAAQRAAQRFLARVPKRLNVGLVGYSDAPQVVVAPSTGDRNEVRATLEALTPDGGTATGDALDAALRAFDAQRTAGRQPPAAIVLLSDGKTTAGRDPVEVARVAGRRHIPIYTVALGTPDGVVPGPFGEAISVPPDPETLRQIAKASGGQAFAVDDAAELDRVYERLGSRVGTRPQRREITAGFAGAGFVLLAGALAAWVRRRGPAW
jgi:Ca-activated chloride channel family protein